ncbi:MAG: hypothetical protein A2Y20_05285 [Firmicutes bacterium GWF2_51_9]|nr:MAG: hypothetical protein A2Y20_05285 [Firmicutes bacterium GWF2_51_9]OGS57619.1 MAG: hypothetical protein A2Y19_05360 [Firmicutes bacterium GWE2_51_13]HAM62207.1 hypothetical protein [Erysipelotrichaceae bacterium]HBZ42028.1 hypothetical protein [Erysipelotrichaceae bacterium]
MIDLYFSDFYAIATTVLVVLCLILSVRSLTSQREPRWGRVILSFIVLGTSVSFLSAMRDAYATPDALFAMTSLQSSVCSIAGMLMFLGGFLALFLRKQRRTLFLGITILFVFKVVVIEASRIAFLIGG